MAGTDRVQTEPARFTASAFVAKGAPAYVYRFSYIRAAMREQWGNGVPHGAEVPYAFDTLGAASRTTPAPLRSAFRLPRELAQKPGLREFPIPHDGLSRDLQYRACLLDG